MRKPLVFILLLITSFAASAQESPRNLVKMNPFYLIDNTFLIGYERFSENFNTSFEVQLGVIASSNTPEGRDGFTSGFMGEIYVKKNVVNRFTEPADKPLWLESLYFAPYVQYKYIKSHWQTGTGETNLEINSIGVGTVFGSHISIARGFYIEPFLGGGVKIGSAKADDPDWRRNWVDILTPEYRGIYPKPGIKFGAKL